MAAAWGDFPCANQFHGEEAAADPHDQFSVPGRDRRSGPGIYVEPLPDDGRISRPPGDFECQPAGCATPSQYADGIVRRTPIVS